MNCLLKYDLIFVKLKLHFNLLFPVLQCLCKWLFYFYIVYIYKLYKVFNTIKCNLIFVSYSNIHIESLLSLITITCIFNQSDLMWEVYILRFCTVMKHYNTVIFSIKFQDLQTVYKIHRFNKHVLLALVVLDVEHLYTYSHLNSTNTLQKGKKEENG